ncbi:MAG: 30S ribosomal protein S1 [Deltaproteobacteria bacterium]|jgi:small subunit ribosomal protein S1|nr:30S ribosomal protein S1 [Deltaproteobacteria bacterium]
MDPTNSKTPENSDFSKMLNNQPANFERYEPGEKISAKLVTISDEWAFLDIGRKGEGVISREELEDKDGNLEVKTGDYIDCFFVYTKNGEYHFTKKIGGGRDAGIEQLENAYHNEIPIEAYVEQEIKGGYEIKLPGNKRGFCPFSQMTLRRSDDNSKFIGTHLTFHIIEFSEKGRNIVVSRRNLLEEEEEEKKEILKEKLQVGQTIEGKITSLQKFGAFVDVGGVEGLIPISHISYNRVEDVSNYLQVGQIVDVEIMSLDWENNRHSFSLKNTLDNPWESLTQLFPVDSVHKAKVARLESYGAFITLTDGIDGLLHISKITNGGKKVKFPAQVLKEGQEIEVKIESVDPVKRRISLAMPGDSNQAPENEENKLYTQFKEKNKNKNKGGMGSLGKLLQKKLDDK